MYISNNIQHFFDSMVKNYSEQHHIPSNEAAKLFEHYNIMYVMMNGPFIVSIKFKEEIYDYIEKYIEKRTATKMVTI